MESLRHINLQTSLGKALKANSYKYICVHANSWHVWEPVYLHMFPTSMDCLKFALLENYNKHLLERCDLFRGKLASNHLSPTVLPRGPSTIRATSFGKRFKTTVLIAVRFLLGSSSGCSLIIDVPGGCFNSGRKGYLAT